MSLIFKPSPMAVAVASVVVCALIWGTTWYAITFQLGVVDPIASIVWRFGLASIVLFAMAKATGQSIRLSRFQHLCASAQGILAFGASYALVYEAEMRVASAIVAVAFASMALMNLIMFRVVERQTAARPVWIGAGLGAVGVVVISGGELIGADLGPVGMVGIAMALGASVASTAGNYFAWKGQGRGTNVLPGTAWAMAYGVAGLGLIGLLTGVHWTIDLSPAYIGSLLYLSIFGSVVAFGLYLNLGRSHGYTLASYIGALTPVIATVISLVFEGARFQWTALAGLILVIAGQVFVIRAPKAP
ncbi:DMT family transporter [Brevundimonas sp.]|uniref:DMT family transporter n=1 Tax=Brevundimonas sp. TaxID=1871086 RepID=UPI00378473A5